MKMFEATIRNIAKRIFLAGWLFILPFIIYSQEVQKRNALSLGFGINRLNHQDLVFSPFIQKSTGYLNPVLKYKRESEFIHEIILQYSNYSAIRNASYTYFENGEEKTAGPHILNFISIKYILAKSVSLPSGNMLHAGGYFGTDLHIGNYVYGRIGNFGYYANTGIGIYSAYEHKLNSKSRISASLQLPIFSWMARSPYLVNDDEFIENQASHSDLKSFLAFMGDGDLVSWNKVQATRFDLSYLYNLNERWGLEASYYLAFLKINDPRPLTSFTNSFSLAMNYKF